MDPLVLRAVFVVTMIVIVPIGFEVFKTRYRFVDVVLAALVSGAALFIPTVGGVASLAAMILVLYWRIGSDLYPDIVVSVVVARLAYIPAAMVFA